MCGGGGGQRSGCVHAWHRQHAAVPTRQALKPIHLSLIDRQCQRPHAWLRNLNPNPNRNFARTRQRVCRRSARASMPPYRYRHHALLATACACTRGHVALHTAPLYMEPGCMSCCAGMNAQHAFAGTLHQDVLSAGLDSALGHHACAHEPYVKASLRLAHLVLVSVDVHARSNPCLHLFKLSLPARHAERCTAILQVAANNELQHHVGPHMPEALRYLHIQCVYYALVG